MSLVEGTREPYSVIRARLRNPPNAVPDKGIDLRRHLRATLPPPSVAKCKHRYAISYSYQFQPVWTQFCGDPVEVLQRIVARRYSIPFDDLLSKRRFSRIVLARQAAMYLARHLLKLSLMEIGRRFGALDHKAVVHGVHKIERLLPITPELQRDIAALTRELGGGK